MIRIPSGRYQVALHTLKDGEGPTLLGLHGVGGSHRDIAPLAAVWPGAVYALDLAGHGASDRLLGSAYSCETWAADADATLAELGEVSLVGLGSGGFAALLASGARPDLIRGTLLLPGPGLSGGGEDPRDRSTAPGRAFHRQLVQAIEAGETQGCDPMVFEIDRHPRPRRYARAFAEAATAVLLGEDDTAQPSWWQEISTLDGTTAVPSDPATALAHLAER